MEGPKANTSGQGVRLPHDHDSWIGIGAPGRRLCCGTAFGEGRADRRTPPSEATANPAPSGAVGPNLAVAADSPAGWWVTRNSEGSGPLLSGREGCHEDPDRDKCQSDAPQHDLGTRTMSFSRYVTHWPSLRSLVFGASMISVGPRSVQLRTRKNPIVAVASVSVAGSSPVERCRTEVPGGRPRTRCSSVAGSMRVLMLTQLYPRGGGGQERHVRDLAQALVARGHEMELATIATSGSGTTTDGSVTVHRLSTTAQRVPHIYEAPDRPHAPPLPDPELRGRDYTLAQRSPFRRCSRSRLDCELSDGPRPPHPDARRIDFARLQPRVRHEANDAREARVCAGPAPVACVRCASAMYGPLVGPGVVLANLVGHHARKRNVATFVPVSPIVASRTNLNKSGEWRVIPNFVPDEILVDPTSLDSVDRPRGPMVFVGDVTLDKGVGVLFAAYRRMSDAPPLVLAGTVQADAPLADRPPGVELLGLTRPEVVLELMRRASVVVVPSIVLDACPTVVLEAMAAGRPVVASACGGIVDLVEDGATEFSFHPETRLLWPRR